MLVVRGKVDYLTRAIPKPNTESATYSIRKAKNSIVMAWLINSMEPKIGKTYLFYKTTKEIWEAVQEIYSDIENNAQCFQIQSTIRMTRQGTNSVTEYYNTLIELW